MFLPTDLLIRAISIYYGIKKIQLYANWANLYS